VALVLTVNSDAWNKHVAALANNIQGLVPVVKGNGYGFGRDWLAERATSVATTTAKFIAIGTTFEVSSVPAECIPVVLTPSLELPDNLRDDAILTVGSIAHIEAVASTKKPHHVVIKIRSSMNRYGCAVGDVAQLLEKCRTTNLQVRGVSIHPPLTGTSAEHVREIEDYSPLLTRRYQHGSVTLIPKISPVCNRDTPIDSGFCVSALRSGTGTKQLFN
jgi:alanine racemase